MTAGDHEHDVALEWASHLRDVRRAICDALGSDEVTLVEVLGERQDPAVAAVHLLTVLEAVPGARKIDTRRGLDEVGLTARAPLGDLGAAERALVIERFATGDGGATNTGRSDEEVGRG